LAVPILALPRAAKRFVALSVDLDRCVLTVDVRIPATALRVMAAHGSFTPTGTDSLTKAGAETLQRLSDVLL
jgi:hypothetical protein